MDINVLLLHQNVHMAITKENSYFGSSSFQILASGLLMRDAISFLFHKEKSVNRLAMMSGVWPVYSENGKVVFNRCVWAYPVLTYAISSVKTS